MVEVLAGSDYRANSGQFGPIRANFSVAAHCGARPKEDSVSRPRNENATIPEPLLFYSVNKGSEQSSRYGYDAGSLGCEDLRDPAKPRLSVITGARPAATMAKAGSAACSKAS